MITRVTKIAVNTDVMMPRPSVIAKPRTGPEPMANRMVAAINVVTLASIMAEVEKEITSWTIKIDVDVNVKNKIKSKAASQGIYLNDFIANLLTDFSKKEG